MRKRGTTLIDLGEYRLIRQVRSASAAPMTGGRCEPNAASLASGAVSMWRKISPSAQVMIDPASGARAVIRDSRSDVGRYLWSVLAAGEMYPVAEGRTDDPAQARSTAEAALGAYSENRPDENSDGRIGEATPGDLVKAKLKLAKDVTSVRKWFLGLPLVVATAIGGISPVSAMVVSTGSQPFDVGWFKVVNNHPFEIDWFKVVDNAGDAITGVAWFGNFAFDGTGLALKTDFDVCAYSGNNCADGSDDGSRPTGSGVPPEDDSFSLTFPGLPTGTTSGDGGTDTLDGAGLFDVTSDWVVNPPRSVSEPAPLALLAGALFLFGWLRSNPFAAGSQPA